MRTIPVPATQLAPLERGRGDNITRLARRTQRGQGGRRVLVAALIALSVLLGVGGAVFAATMAESDATVGVADQFGSAEAKVMVSDPRTQDRLEFGVEDLSPEQQAWLAAHDPVTEVPTGDPALELPLDVRQALGFAPVTVRPDEVLGALDLPPDEALTYAWSTVWGLFEPDEDALVTTLDVTHPLAGTTLDADGRTTALTGDEALLSPSLSSFTGAEVGDTVDLPGIGTVEVVGTVTRAFQRSQHVVVLAPDADTTTLPWGELVVRFADVEDARSYDGIAQDLAAERAADLPQPTPEQFELVGMAPTEAAGFTPYVDAGWVQTRAEFLSTSVADRSLAAVIGATVTGLATVVAAVVGACAFAVGIRRRIREIGMLGAIGASPSQLGRLLRREGLVIGLGGAVAGAALALVLAVPALPLVEVLVDRDLQLTVPVFASLLPVVVGALGAFLAAAWPARTAARVPVVTALAGRVPLGAVPVWLPVVGAVAAAGGIALLADLVLGAPTNDGLAAVQLLAAVLLATLGTASLGIPVIQLGGRVADRLPLLGRLALRDAARQRTRSAAAVAALVPVLAIPVAAGTIWLSQNALWASPSGPVTHDGVVLETLSPNEVAPAARAVVDGAYVQGREVPPTQQHVTAVSRILPGATAAADLATLGLPELPGRASAMLPHTTTGAVDVDLTAFRDQDVLDAWAWGVGLTLATPDVVAALGLPVDAVPADGALLLERTTWVALPATVDELVVVQADPDAAPDEVLGGDGVGSQRVLGTVDLVRDATVTGAVDVGLLVGEDAAARLGLVETGRSVLLTLDRAPTQPEAFAANQLADDAGATGGYVRLAGARPFWRTPLGLTLLTIVGVALAALGVSVVAGMTSALAATESDADVRKAVALGAAPSLRRWLHGLQAWWHVLIAAVLGSALGLAVAQAFVRSIVIATEFDANGQVASQITGTITVPWLPLLGWVVVIPVLVGLVIAGVMRSAPVGAPRRRTA